MASSKEIRRRIKSTQNIAKITKAMELTSAAKMRKTQAQALASRPYATLSRQLLKNLIAKSQITNQPLLNRVMPEDYIRKEPGKILNILITSDRGLAGAFNSNVINKALEILKNSGEPKETFDFITIGRKGTDVVKRLGYNIVATFSGMDKPNSVEQARPIAEIGMQDFLNFKYDKVFVIYSDFVSTLVQKPNVLQVLPFEKGEERGAEKMEDFLFEPSPDDVLETLVVRVIEFAIFQSLVEAAASEHSARMVAMRNANEAADDLIDDLSLSYNQARQAGITRELSEISAAKLAMEG
jgi:F-type H+-transporting ATPase subunit gamma